MQPVPDTAQLQLVWTDANAGIRVNSFYFELAAGWATADLELLAAEAAVEYITHLAPFAPDDSVVACPLTAIIVRDLSVAAGEVVEIPTDADGTSAAAFASANNAAVVNFLTAGAGAPRKGRIFWPFVPEAEVGYGGNLQGTYRADLATAVEDFVQALEAGVAGAEHVVVSRFSKSAVPAPPHERPVPLTKEVASYSVRTVIGSQRDRRVGEGG